MKDFKIGIQLYSLRNELAKDFEKTLEEVAKIGYKYVEFAGFYEKKPEEIKEILDKYGLCAISSHTTVDCIEGQIDYYKVLGIKYVAIPWMSIDVLRDKEKFAEFIENVKKAGKLLKDNGIQLLYHNHNFEFEKVDGEYIFDRIYSSVDPELLQTEIDTCWVKFAELDPCDIMRQYKDRAEVLHLKDFYSKKLNTSGVFELIGNDDEKEEEKNDSFEFRPIGGGIQNFPEIIKTADEIGIEYLIVEQDEPKITPLYDAKTSFEYLKTIL